MAKKNTFKIEKKTIGLAALLLTSFAILGIGLVAVTKTITTERIAEQQLRTLLNSLNDLIPKHLYDNNLVMDITTGQDKLLLGSHGPHTIYRARKQGKPIAVIINIVTTDGFNSAEIKISVGITLNGTILGVRVISHKETPGLGDKIMLNRSNWILSFNGKSLHNHSKQQWKVIKDGGDFDAFTGATITPRAVINAVYKTLHYYKKHKNIIFTPINIITKDKKSINNNHQAEPCKLKPKTRNNT